MLIAVKEQDCALSVFLVLQLVVAAPCMQLWWPACDAAHGALPVCLDAHWCSSGLAASTHSCLPRVCLFSAQLDPATGAAEGWLRAYSAALSPLVFSYLLCRWTQQQAQWSAGCGPQTCTPVRWWQQKQTQMRLKQAASRWRRRATARPRCSTALLTMKTAGGYSSQVGGWQR